MIGNSAPMVRNVEKQNGRISHVREEEGEWDEDEQEPNLEFAPASNVIKHVIEIQLGLGGASGAGIMEPMHFQVAEK